jgi:hypothetical protein
MHPVSFLHASASVNAAFHHAPHVISAIMLVHVVLYIMHHVSCVVSHWCMIGAAGRVMNHVPVVHEW